MLRIAICLIVVSTAVCAQPVLSQSLANDWSHVWGPPYYTDDLPTGESTYGLVDQLNYVWWLEWFSPTINLPAGTYGARVRVKKIISTAGRYTLTLSQNGTSNSVDLLGSSQPVDQWIWTPDLEFTVPAGGGSVAFRFVNLNGSQKQNYWFDEFQIRQADWETNKPEASSDVNGVLTTGYDPAVTSACSGSTATLNFASTEVGQPWDFGYAFTPSLSGSATALQTGTGQKVNVNLVHPTFQYFNGGTFSVPFGGNFSLPITVPALGVASMQSAHIAPAHPDGIGLSQASHLDIVGGTSVPLVMGDDTVIYIPFQTAPYCSSLPGINFYGTNYQTMWVHSNGEVHFGFPTTTAIPTLNQFTSWMPRVSGMWTDLTANISGTVSVLATANDIKISFANVASQGVAATASSVDITFTATGSTIIDNYLPDGAHAIDTIVGISRGSGSTNPGPMGGSTLGTILGLAGAGLQSGLATDSVYEMTTGSLPAGGWSSLEFPNSDGSAYIVN